MGLKWLIFVCFVVAVAARSMPVPDEDEYDYDGWWSDEASPDELGAVNSAIDKLLSNDNIDDLDPEASVEDSEETEAKTTINNISKENVASQENTNDENVLDDDGEFEKFIRELNEPFGERNAVPNNDYLVEDNRSDIKEEDLGNNDDLPKLDSLPEDSAEFDENLENIDFNKESLEIPSQIIEESKKIQLEVNGAYEEDIEDQDLVISENQNEKSDELQPNQSNEDNIGEKIDDDVKDFLNEIENKSEGDLDESENKDNESVIDNGFEDLTFLQKYENDMINPEETKSDDEHVNSSEKEDNDNAEDEEEDDLNTDLEKLFASWEKLTEDDESANQNEETDKLQLNQSNEDHIRENIDDVVENFLNGNEKKSDDNLDESENNDDESAIDNGIEDLTFLLKYENDMIDPEETETDIENVNSSEQEDNDDEEEEEEDTADKVYKDLNDDLDKLFATWDKLTDDDQTSEDTKEKNDLSIEEYEEKYGRPYKEGVILNQRDDFNAAIYDDVVDSIVVDTVPDRYAPSIVDLNKYLSHEEEDTSKSPQIDEISLNEPIYKKTSVLPSLIMSDNDNNDEDRENFELVPKPVSTSDNYVTEKEYADLIYKFKIDHHDEIAANVQEESDFPANRYTLRAPDQTIEITSANFPDAYPTNNVVDWIIESEDWMQGIELNITDLDLRGAQGDYLLINPGGVRDGQGLLFSYQLPAVTNLRQYRFITTNRLFIRFNAGAGLNFLSGFRLTVKSIWSSPLDEDEDLPAPEALIPAPPATLTVKLGGLRYPYFSEIKDVFRRIVADMATMYINANGINPGLNTTLETTQITNIASCNVNWPSFEDCVAVTFGVPLVYDSEIEFYGEENEVRLNQDDLINMWTTYVSQDPFAARLRVLGITEFAVPNDNRMIMMWAVLGVGIFIAAVILSLTLWRFSCFEGYSRMKEMNDTDSLSHGKRGLDLYPTPHQPLPPLYTDNDEKWADSKYNDTTRVDLGGFANRSYARDELLDIDSDEETIATRDRNAAISPRNIYQV